MSAAKLFLIVLILSLIPLRLKAAEQYPGEFRNYALHAVTGFALTETLYLLFKKSDRLTRTDCYVLAASLISVLGVVKELHDDSFSARDVLANEAGAVGAGFTIKLFNL